MKDGFRENRTRVPRWLFVALLAFLGMFLHDALYAFTLNVTDRNGDPVSGFRYIVEVDTTVLTEPGVPVSDSISLSIHNSYAPPVASGASATDTAEVTVPETGRYYVSVLPDSGYALGGAQAAAGQAVVTVIVQEHPLPTSQIYLFVFVDQNPINNAWDETEPGIGGARVLLADFSGGAISQDAFGNLLGTTYQFTDVNGNGIHDTGEPYVLDVDGNPIVDVPGNGEITTLTQAQFDAGEPGNPFNLQVGEVLVRYLPPGKYGITIVPPQFDDNGVPITWSQTSTIEGTKTVDAWVKANEPRLFVEGFGVGVWHAFFGFTKVSPVTPSPSLGQVFETTPWNVAAPPGGTGSIEGTFRYNHFSRPPNNQGYFAGEPVPECWVGLNDPFAAVEVVGSPAGLYHAPCDENSHFVIPNVPPGEYQLVSWDTPLLALFGVNAVTVGEGEDVDLGDVLVFRWFGSLEGNVFFDTDMDGFQDPGEGGIANQNINLRFRDGTVYQANASDSTGEYGLSGVFPFFKWLVPEIDFARFRATGMTAVVDHGGEIPPHNGWIMPSFDKLTPQPQAAVNPNTGNNLSRTETGPVLTQAMHLFLNQTNRIDWGKIPYSPAGSPEYALHPNGGISGLVFYDTTRAENDPAFNAGEPWQPGIPRVQVCLYNDNNADTVIDDFNGSPGIQLCDVDNYPFGWSEGGAIGTEDVVRSGDGVTFNSGDAIEVTWTDSWDDNKPSGCIQDIPIIHGVPAPECADSYGTWNQVRPGLFDGGYAFGEAAGGVVPSGTYIVETVPPPVYAVVKEEDKNVDFGDPYTPSTLLLPPPCVGTVANGLPVHVVPDELALFPGVPIDPPLAGSTTPLCSMKQVTVLDSQNAAADFFLFTEVPVSAQAVGFVNNDFAAEFNMASPIFGEKLSPAWLPVAIRDWTGTEIGRVYADEFGSYNFRIPSTYSIYVPTPSGVAPNMITLVLNDPVMPDGTPDPFYNPIYAVTTWTFNYQPGATTYLDTPIVPTAAFSAAGTALDTAPPTLTPGIGSVIVTGPDAQAGPLVCSDAGDATIEITSVGMVDVLNPNFVPGNLGEPFMVTRDYGFGTTMGAVTIDGEPISVTGWNDTTITATVPADTPTGVLLVTRGDNGFTSDIGATVMVDDCTGFDVIDVPATFATIQEAIDDPGTTAGDVIVVAAGQYGENVILYKPLRLLGAGPGATTINGNPIPLERLDLWHARINELGGDAFEAFLLKPVFREHEAPGVIVFGETVYPQGNIQAPEACDLDNFDPAFCSLFNEGNPFDTPGQASVQNFTLSGSKAGGGLAATSGARYFIARTNNVTGNQGNYAGGIAIGIPDNGFDNKNINISLLHNKIHRNGGFQGAGGIAVAEYSADYLIEGNLIISNLSQRNGGGIGHYGVCPGENIIRNNKVVFNEAFFGALWLNAGDGGGIAVQGDIIGGTGSGNVTIDSNLVQGNLSGSGYGGGIRAYAVNGADIADNPDDSGAWHRLTITNNIIVNNVAAVAGGGIALQDAYAPVIMNNTIANNDSTSTGRLAFEAGQLNSTPLPAGIQSGENGAALQAALLAATAADTSNFSNPRLVNNIVWHNRSFFNDASQNGGAGGLSPHPTLPYWDLGVTGTVAASYMNPDSCLLTALAYADGSDYDDGSNIAGNPAFVSDYINTLETATVIDEGGNNITVRIFPLAVTGDYHILAASAAIDEGEAVANDHDYDGEARPGGAGFDIGADEFDAGTVPPAATRIGVYSMPTWYLDDNGNGAWDGAPTDLVYSFGFAGSVAVTGDWNGNGTTKIGAYMDGNWYLDYNGNGAWDGPVVDRYYSFGYPGAVPVTGDWNGTGTTKVGVYDDGIWYVDLNGNGAWDGTPTDSIYNFGYAGTIPATGDWTGTGTTQIAVYDGGTWFMDMNGNHEWNGTPTDAIRFFGYGGAIPVTGDWDGNGSTNLGVYDGGTWYLDLNGNNAWDGSPTDAVESFGFGGATPVSGRW